MKLLQCKGKDAREYNKEKKGTRSLSFEK